MSAQRATGDVEMTIVEHLEELRDRLIVMVVALVVSTGFSAIFTRWLLNVLMRIPGPEFQPVALSPVEPVVVYMKVALIAGVGLAMPVILYEVVRYLLPALTPEEKGYLYMLLPLATVSYLVGVAFAVTLVLPAAMGFLINFLPEVLKLWSLDKYISFVTTVMFWMGVIFELPVVLFFLTKLGIVNAAMLSRLRRVAIVASAVIAAVVTPTPDPVNMLIVMVPLVLLYELGILLSRLAARRGPRVSSSHGAG